MELAGARSVRIPLDHLEGHDLEAMAAAVTDRTKVILLCTPNNPTGVPISHDRLEAFLRSVRSDVLVVIDEAYVEYADAGSGPDSLALYRRYPNVCILRTFSKAYGLAGLRVGYAITTAAIVEGLRRTALPFAVSALAQQAAIASLDAGEEMAARVSLVKRERARMAAELEAQGWKLQSSQGNFLWIRADEQFLATLVDAFDAAGILVRAYPGDGVRITVADPASNNRVLRLLAAHAASASRRTEQELPVHQPVDGPGLRGGMPKFLPRQSKAARPTNVPRPDREAGPSRPAARGYQARVGGDRAD